METSNVFESSWMSQRMARSVNRSVQRRSDELADRSGLHDPPVAAATPFTLRIPEMDEKHSDSCQWSVSTVTETGEGAEKATVASNGRYSDVLARWAAPSDTPAEFTPDHLQDLKARLSAALSSESASSRLRYRHESVSQTQSQDSRPSSRRRSPSPSTTAVRSAGTLIRSLLATSEPVLLPRATAETVLGTTPHPHEVAASLAWRNRCEAFFACVTCETLIWNLCVILGAFVLEFENVIRTRIVKRLCWMICCESGVLVFASLCC